MLKYALNTRFAAKKTPRKNVLSFDYGILNFRIFFENVAIFLADTVILLVILIGYNNSACHTDGSKQFCLSF
jgi:hypothetical protein